MSDPNIAISAKNLGCINVKKYCPRCLWYLYRARFSPPYRFSGRLFTDAESCQKAVAWHYLENCEFLPMQFGPIKDCCARVDFPRDYRRFRYTHKSGIELFGIPDDIFKREDGTLAVVDYKSAHAKGEEDPFHGQYVTQVTGYANIAEVGLDLGTVSIGALLYWEAAVDDVIAKPEDFYSLGRLSLPMDLTAYKVKIDYKMLDPLIEELVEVTSASNPPSAHTGCKDCKKLDVLFAIEQELRVNDRLLLNMNPDRPIMRKEINNRTFARESYLRDLLAEVDENEIGLFASDGMAAGWEFDNDEQWALGV